MRIGLFCTDRRRRRTLVGVIVVLALATIVILPSRQPEAVVPDRDRDGLSNRFERKRSHTNPGKADTDGDRLRDRFELRRSHTNPRKADTDGDGLRDRFELRTLKTNPRRKDTDCMLRPSACGFPDIGSVGVKTPARQLQVVNRDVDLTVAATVYENRDVRGCITVRAPRVTIRNVKISCRSNTPIRSLDGEGNTGGLLVEDVEIDFLNFMYGGSGASNLTFRRVFIHNGADCVTASHDVVIEDSLCSLGPDANDDGWADSTGFCTGSDAHFDGFQGDASMNRVTFRHNTIRNPCDQTSAILVGHVEGGSTNIVVDRNLVAGGGYTIYCEDRNLNVPMTLTNNRFARTFFRRAGHYGPTTSCRGSNVTASGNLWDDTGAPLRPR
jgi:hypothetical protein